MTSLISLVSFQDVLKHTFKSAIQLTARERDFLLNQHNAFFEVVPKYCQWAQRKITVFYSESSLVKHLTPLLFPYSSCPPLLLKQPIPLNTWKSVTSILARAVIQVVFPAVYGTVQKKV